MKIIQKAFLRVIAPQAVMAGAAILFFGMVAFLTRFSIDYFFYSLLLLVSFIAVFWFFQWVRYLEKYRNLKHQFGLEDEFDSIEDIYQAKLQVLEEHLKDQVQESREKEQQQMDYFTLWLHQIKTPLAALSLIQQQLPYTESKKQIEQELVRLEDYTHMTLNYLKLEGTNQELDLVDIDVDIVIRKVLKKYASLFVYNHIQLIYEPTNLHVVSDGKWLEVIVEQLLSNSLKYANEGKILIYAKGQQLIIEDNGSGIRAEDLPKIFEKGYTGLSGRLHEKSTGLGLFLSRMICKRLGLQLEIESEVGEYTRAILHLNHEDISLFD